MKKRLIPLAVASGLVGGCEKSTFPGDKLTPPYVPCEPAQITNVSCQATNPETREISFDLLHALQSCDPSDLAKVGFTIEGTNNPVTSRKISGKGQQRTQNTGTSTDSLKDVSPTLASGFTGTIKTTAQSLGDLLLKVRTINENGQLELKDAFLINNCPRVPPCENQLIEDCTYLNPYNKCVAATTYKFDLCEATVLKMKFSTNGFGLARFSSGAYCPITRTIHHTNGTTTQINRDPSNAVEFELLPGETITVLFTADRILPVPSIVGSSQLTIHNHHEVDLDEHIITMVNDNC